MQRGSNENWWSIILRKDTGSDFIPAEDPEALSNAILSVVKKEKNRAHVEDFLVKNLV